MNINFENLLETETLYLFLNNYCYSTSEVAELCNVHIRTINRWVHKGKIKPIVYNGAFIFATNEVERLLENR